jgi:Ni/Co efflux regulator RcnB
MRKIALLVFALCLLCWRPSSATTQPLPQAANFQDRDDHRDQDRDRRDADHRDGDRRDADRRDNDRDNDSYRDHFRDRNSYGRFPRGSYARTCRDIRMEGTTLRASCQKNDTRFRDTSLKHADQCHAQLINDNGKLRCM